MKINSCIHIHARIYLWSFFLLLWHPTKLKNETTIKTATDKCLVFPEFFLCIYIDATVSIGPSLCSVTDWPHFLSSYSYQYSLFLEWKSYQNWFAKNDMENKSKRNYFIIFLWQMLQIVLKLQNWQAALLRMTAYKNLKMMSHCRRRCHTKHQWNSIPCPKKTLMYLSQKMHAN